MKKILVIQTASIGDVILATALVENLHRIFPQSSIDFLTKKGNESLFTGHPFLHHVIIWNKQSEKYKSLLRILFQVRQTKYDLVINIQRFFLTGLFTIFSGASETRGFSKNPLSFLYTKRMSHLIGNGIHEVTRNQELIRDFSTSHMINPRMYPSAADEAAVSQFSNGNYYTISPASLWFTKQYPVDKWIELVSSLPREAPVYLLGAMGDQQLCDKIIAAADRQTLTSLAGKLTFLQSAALMKKARMNFTNDSAPMHLASAVNAPVTAIYCSTVPEFGFGPLSDFSHIVQTSEPLACRPCSLHGCRSCPEKHFRCATGIRIEQLMEQA